MSLEIRNKFFKASAAAHNYSWTLVGVTAPKYSVVVVPKGGRDARTIVAREDIICHCRALMEDLQRIVMAGFVPPEELRTIVILDCTVEPRIEKFVFIHRHEDTLKLSLLYNWERPELVEQSGIIRTVTERIECGWEYSISELKQRVAAG